jgi:secreted Zn-dependent insulinase-like peptidase
MLDINIEKPKKSRAQKILDDIEANLRNLIKEKKELWKKFLEKRREFDRLEKQYKDD